MKDRDNQITQPFTENNITMLLLTLTTYSLPQKNVNLTGLSEDINQSNTCSIVQRKEKAAFLQHNGINSKLHDSRTVRLARCTVDGLVTLFV